MRNSWLDSLSPQRRTTYTLLFLAIVMTLPCYCVGFALLNTPVSTPEAQQFFTPTPFIWTPSPTATSNIATPTPVLPIETPTPTDTLEPTPTQYFPTVVPTATPTFTPRPTATPTSSQPT
ncbi:MAG TPA: hypothetical protein ENJ48_02495, partial [Anaerolineae bacterium]|nr:hypothetical protein [Anaerolineae bacterium]